MADLLLGGTQKDTGEIDGVMGKGTFVTLKSVMTHRNALQTLKVYDSRGVAAALSMRRLRIFLKAWSPNSIVSKDGRPR